MPTTIKAHIWQSRWAGNVKQSQPKVIVVVTFVTPCSSVLQQPQNPLKRFPFPSPTVLCVRVNRLVCLFAKSISQHHQLHCESRASGARVVNCADNRCVWQLESKTWLLGAQLMAQVAIKGIEKRSSYQKLVGRSDYNLNTLIQLAANSCYLKKKQKRN